MEGPSLFLAKEQLEPFIGQKINQVAGNTKTPKERLLDKKLESIISFGKQLFFQFDMFALRVHFMLFGSFEAFINEEKITGDYPRKNRVPRLALHFDKGEIIFYSCSIRFIEHSHIEDLCDFTIDIMSKTWDSNKALNKLQSHPDVEIGDALLDQTLFAGVGNIIKNESLLLAKILPTTKIQDLTVAELKRVIKYTHAYVFKFYAWRKKFELKKHYKIYRQSFCKECGNKVQKKWTGVRHRVSYMCPICQK